MPIVQFLYTQSLEALPMVQNPDPDDYKPKQCRYDGQAAIFGWPFQELLAEQRWFIVGAGAIGCELHKVV